MKEMCFRSALTWQDSGQRLGPGLWPSLLLCLSERLLLSARCRLVCWRRGAHLHLPPQFSPWLSLWMGPGRESGVQREGWRLPLWGCTLSSFQSPAAWVGGRGGRDIFKSSQDTESQDTDYFCVNYWWMKRIRLLETSPHSVMPREFTGLTVLMEVGAGCEVSWSEKGTWKQEYDSHPLKWIPCD